MALTDDARRERNEYMRRWRRDNPDKVRQYQETYWSRKSASERQKERQKAAESGSCDENRRPKTKEG